MGFLGDAQDDAGERFQQAKYIKALEEQLHRLQDERNALLARAEKAEAFKSWTHQYLDAHGVPHHPPGTHGAAGCRIGDRMDWLMAKLDAATAGASAGRSEQSAT
jgi:hypothetical protein